MKKIIQLLFFSLLSVCATIAFALPNPASVNCVKNNNKLIMIKNTGICIFSDNTYCEEWAYFRGKCKQGQNAFPGGKFDKKKIGQYCITRTGAPMKVVSVKMCKAMQ